MIEQNATTDHSDSLSKWIREHWLIIFAVGYGIWVWMPFLAPIFMRFGWEAPADMIYFLYSFFCHQMPQRSYFLFGPKTSYSLIEIQTAWIDTINPLILRKFNGSTAMGWKIAWSDRMIFFYGGIWVFSLFWWQLRNWVKRLPWWGLILLLLPIALDGGTHFISDLAGIGQGFRDSNFWLSELTKQSLSPTFYAGDALGSFNAWMRIISGLLAGLGLVWFGFPYIAEIFSAD